MQKLIHQDVYKTWKTHSTRKKILQSEKLQVIKAMNTKNKPFKNTIPEHFETSLTTGLVLSFPRSNASDTMGIATSRNTVLGEAS